MALLIVLHYLTWVIIFWDFYSFQFSAYCLVPKSKTHILGFCYCSTSFTHTAFVSVTHCCVTNLPKTELLKTIIFLRTWFCRSALVAGLIQSSAVCWEWVRWLHFWRLSGWVDWLSFTHLTVFLSYPSSMRTGLLFHGKAKVQMQPSPMVPENERKRTRPLRV